MNKQKSILYVFLIVAALLYLLVWICPSTTEEEKIIERSVFIECEHGIEVEGLNGEKEVLYVSIMVKVPEHFTVNMLSGSIIQVHSVEDIYYLKLGGDKESFYARVK